MKPRFAYEPAAGWETGHGAAREHVQERALSKRMTPTRGVLRLDAENPVHQFVRHLVLALRTQVLAAPQENDAPSHVQAKRSERIREMIREGKTAKEIKVELGASYTCVHQTRRRMRKP